METLKEFIRMWEANGTQFQHEVNHFRCGNGEKETTDRAITLPVSLAGSAK